MAPSPRDASHVPQVQNYIDSWRSVIHLVRSGYSWSGHEKNCVFLNCTPPSSRDAGTPSYVSASAVSGLDLPDDARALAVVDWDQDGDLDVWLHNRSAPRLRLMLNRTNELAPGQRAITMRLVGTTCNRDAIGARVKLMYETPEVRSRTLVRSVRAGDAFLSQSSSGLHFGVSEDATHVEVRVAWPGGTEESIVGVNDAGHYEIQQGTGNAHLVAARRAVQLSARVNERLADTAAARVILPGRIQLPRLTMRNHESGEKAAIDYRSPTTLITFWTSSCANCCRELNEFAKQQERLAAAGLDVVAVCLDSIDSQDGTDLAIDDDALAASREFLRSINFPFRRGDAVTQSIDEIRLFQNSLFGKYPDFVVPLSMLVDRQGNVVAIYRGAFPLDSLLQDTQLIALDDNTLRSLAPPVAGTWITKPASASQFAAFVGGRLLASAPELALAYYQQAAQLADSDAERAAANVKAAEIAAQIASFAERP